MSDRRPSRAIVIGTVATVAGAVIALLAWLQPQDAGPDEPAKQPARITLETARISNPEPRYRTVDAEDLHPTSVQTKGSSPTIDVTLLNRGDRRAVIRTAIIDIESYAELPVCFTQGGGDDIEVTGSYHIKLPRNPDGAALHVEHPLRQQIGPDEVDRFLLRFVAPTDDAAFRLYQLRVRFRTSEDQRVDAGRFLISTPGPVSRSGEILPEEDNVLENAAGIAAQRLETLWCFNRNLLALRRVLDGTGQRAPAVAALADVAPTARWRQLIRATPPRSAAEALLRKDGTAPALAVVAAEQTDEADFAADVRRRAAVALRDRARDALDEDRAFGALQLARAALAVQADDPTRRLLREAERQHAADLAKAKAEEAKSESSG